MLFHRKILIVFADNIGLISYEFNTTQLHSTKPELRFCAGSNTARVVSEIRDGEDLRQW